MCCALRLWHCLTHYSAAECAGPVWKCLVRSSQLDPVVNDRCRLITGYLDPTLAISTCLLVSHPPLPLRYAASSKQVRSKRLQDPFHVLFKHKLPALPYAQSMGRGIPDEMPPMIKIMTIKLIFSSVLVSLN